ncbi:apoptosis-antagonizing transcription factor [Hygrophoropsis aurantiaca]|uniref:Apoptosis-antagonizing transcription factor n=1 Tax=Hygrophoropsis aurantiaca TaxID=72124 RepID=A0ACB8APH2_9AGAM|nr:apoptosis-antagonizing transcription factor [Hygrophoropsis aurantiaca]
MSMSRLSLAQQIAQLEETAPIDFDPEDVQISNEHPESDQDFPDASAGREHYIDVGPSALRKLHDSIADPKYDGIKTSRRQLMDDEDDENIESELEEDYDQDPSEGQSDHDEDEDEEPPSSNSEIEQPQPKTTRHKLSPKLSAQRPDQRAPGDDLASSLRKTRDEDRKKGKAVSRQIAVWDSLLDARIRLQKTVAAGNRLPFLGGHKDSDDIQNALNKMLKEAQLLSEDLFELQEDLLTNNESIQPPPRKRLRISQDQDQDSGTSILHLREATHTASALEHAFHSHLIHTLTKWSSKIQAAAPPTKTTFSSKPSTLTKSAAQLVDETLSEHAKVLARTRIWRGKGIRLGPDMQGDEEMENDNGEDPELFDETDFYHQLLRDVIDTRGNSGGDDWITVQKQQKARKKKGVDTKASKGRKLRYQVHEKIQNFMMPVPVQSWHEEQMDELFASLLGRGFEGARNLEAGDIDGNEDVRALDIDLDAALSGGFRVFG